MEQAIEVDNVAICVFRSTVLPLIVSLSLSLSPSSHVHAHKYIRRWAMVQNYTTFWANMSTTSLCEGTVFFVLHGSINSLPCAYMY